MTEGKRTPRTGRTVVGMLVVTAFVTLLPMATATATPPLGTGSPGQTMVSQAATSPVGSYEIYSSNGGQGSFTLGVDGSFTTDYGDSGM
jgi:hypothetical protein